VGTGKELNREKWFFPENLLNEPNKKKKKKKMACCTPEAAGPNFIGTGLPATVNPGPWEGAIIAKVLPADPTSSTN